jgi:F-box domain
MSEMTAQSMPFAKSISNVPNELLAEIFSYIKMDDVVKWSENGQERKLVQVMALLHVCRAFRMAVFESRVFLDWEFDFACLIPNANTHNNQTITRITSLLETLLDDQHFISTLARKRDWMFREPPDVLLTILSRVPTLARSAQKFHLAIDDFTNRALNRLSDCAGITHLAADPGSAPIRFDRIAQNFPCLEHLIVYPGCEMYNYLHSLTRLKSLEFMVCAEFPSSEASALGQSVLPYGSANTLTELKIHRGALDRLTFNLAPFLNLKHIDFGNCPQDDIKYCLWTLDVHLETFECDIEDGGLVDPLFSEIFTYRSLSWLKSLTLRGQLFFWEDLSAFVDGCMGIVTVVAQHLRPLEHFSLLNLGMDVGNLECLSRLRNLKSITWELQSDKGYIRGDGLPEEALAKAFKSLAVKPKIEVFMNGGYRPREKSRWPDDF